jgi:hypothetical protein
MPALYGSQDGRHHLAGDLRMHCSVAAKIRG